MFVHLNQEHLLKILILWNNWYIRKSFCQLCILCADYLVIFGNISGGLTTTQSNFYENKFSLALN